MNKLDKMKEEALANLRATFLKYLLVQAGFAATVAVILIGWILLGFLTSIPVSVVVILTMFTAVILIIPIKNIIELTEVYKAKKQEIERIIHEANVKEVC